MMPNTFTEHPLPGSIKPGGLTVDEQGKVWFVDKNTSQGKPAKVYRLKENGTIDDNGVYELPIPDASSTPSPMYLAYQPAKAISDSSPAQILVTDGATGKLHFITLSETPVIGQLSLKATGHEYPRPRGIVWHAFYKYFVVADDAASAGRLLIIKPKETGGVEIDSDHILNQKASMVSVAPITHFTWFVQGITGGELVRCENAQITKQFKAPHANFDPLGLTVDVHDEVWVTDYAQAALWMLGEDEQHNANAQWRKVVDFKPGSRPRQIMVDNSGHLWVSLSGQLSGTDAENIGHSVVQLTGTGEVVLEHKIPAVGSSLSVPTDLAYVPATDTIWVCDDANSRVLALQPAKAPSNAKVTPISITASAAPGQLFKEWSFDTDVKDCPFTLVTVQNDEDIAYFTNGFTGQSYACTVWPDADGHVKVSTLRVSSNAPATQVRVLASARGLAKKLVFTGEIGPTVDVLSAVDDAKDYARANQPFSRRLAVLARTDSQPLRDAIIRFTVTGATGVQIIDHAGSTCEIRTNSEGIAFIQLQAGAAFGAVTIEAESIVPGGKAPKVTFQPRIVTPVPTKLEMTPDNQAELTENGPGSDSIVATLTNDAGVPVPNERLLFEIVQAPLAGGLISVAGYFQTPGSAGKNTTIVCLTDDNGKVSFPNEDYAIYAASIGTIILKVTVLDSSLLIKEGHYKVRAS